MPEKTAKICIRMQCLIRVYTLVNLSSNILDTSTGSRIDLFKYWPLSCWTQIDPTFANSVDPDQLASEEANWSGSALFAIKYVNPYQQTRSSNLIGWKLEVGMAS